MNEFHRLLGLAASVVVCVPIVLAAGPAPASALVVASAGVEVTKIPGGFEACAEGAATGALVLVGTWRFAIVGARSDTTMITIGDEQSGARYDECIEVYKNWTDEGGFTATLTYQGQGWDVVATVVGTGTWDPINGDKTSGMHN